MVIENKHNRRKPGPCHIIRIAPCTRVFALRSDPGLSNLWQTSLYYTMEALPYAVLKHPFESLPENITFPSRRSSATEVLHWTRTGEQSIFISPSGSRIGKGGGYDTVHTKFRRGKKLGASPV